MEQRSLDWLTRLNGFSDIFYDVRACDRRGCCCNRRIDADNAMLVQKTALHQLARSSSIKMSSNVINVFVVRGAASGWCGEGKSIDGSRRRRRHEAYLAKFDIVQPAQIAQQMEQSPAWQGGWCQRPYGGRPLRSVSLRCYSDPPTHPLHFSPCCVLEHWSPLASLR